MKSGADVVRPEEVWNKYFPSAVRNIPTKDYLSVVVLPRPRDLIFFVKASLEFAVNRGRGRIEEADLISAQPQYSHFALNSVLSEATPRIAEMDDLLLEFAGGPEIVDEERIKVAMRRAGINEMRIGEVVELLTELTFLGPETAAGRFEFIYDEDDLTKAKVMARNLAEDTNIPTRYRVNPAFHAFLDIAPQQSAALGQGQLNL